MSGFGIRRLGAGDIATLRGVNAMFAEGFGDEGDHYSDAPPDDGWLIDLLNQSHVAIFAAETSGQVIGGLLAYELMKPEQAWREYYIYDLAVLAPWRRRGVATQLISEVCTLARDRGAWSVFVQADYGDDPAIALYTKLGHREAVLHFDIKPAP